jgi:ABC-2 type transport system permease protein
MSLRSILTVGLGDLRLTRKERGPLFWMLIMPVAFVAIFGNMFRAGDTPLPGLAVVDADGTFASRSFVEMLTRERLALRVLQPAERDTAKNLVRVLTLPRGFEDSLATSRRVAIRLEPVGGRSQEYELATKVAVYKAVIRMLAALSAADSSGSADRSAFESPQYQARFAAEVASPERVSTLVRTAGKGHALPTGFGASASSMLVLFLMMNTVIYGAVLLTQEKQSRCLMRLAMMPMSRADLILGKISGRLMIALIQSLILLVAGSLIFHVYWGPSPLALGCVIVSLGLCAAALGLLLGAILRTPEQAGAVSWIVPLFLGAIGGTWWPLEIVPPWMRVAAHVSPAAWAMDALHGLIAFGKGPGVVIVPCVVLVAAGTVMTLIAARLLRTE